MSAPAPATPAIEPWWELRVRVPAILCEDLSALFIEEGAMGVQTLDAQAPETSHPQGHASLGPARAIREAGTLGVAESAEAWAQARGESASAELGTLVASFEGSLSRDAVLDLARENLRWEYESSCRADGPQPDCRVVVKETAARGTFYRGT